MLVAIKNIQTSENETESDETSVSQHASKDVYAACHLLVWHTKPMSACVSTSQARTCKSPN